MFNGKAIYNPKGAAGEYAEWGCNFYTGCSNNCDYCYLKRGVLSRVWSLTPTLKKCFKDEKDAIRIFDSELLTNILEIRESGLFFSFSTDPLLVETRELTRHAVSECMNYNVPVKILTKRADGAEWLVTQLENDNPRMFEERRNLVAIGFTLTGHDELEPNSTPTKERILALHHIKAKGVRTFASIEPMIDEETAADVITATLACCDLYKIGLMSGGKKRDNSKLLDFCCWVRGVTFDVGAKVYFKESVRKVLRENTPTSWSVVDSDYNMFKP